MIPTPDKGASVHPERMDTCYFKHKGLMNMLKESSKITEEEVICFM